VNKDLLDLLDACVPLGDPRADRDVIGRGLIGMLDAALMDLDLAHAWRLLAELADLEDTRRMAAWAAETN